MLERKMNETEFKTRLCQAEQGKKLFKQIFDVDKLSLRDTFILVLTDQQECIHYGAKYLPEFIEYYKRNVYVFLSDIQYRDLFLEAGGNVKVCNDEELENLAAYFNVFRRNDAFDVKIVFLTEKDIYGSSVNVLLERKEFSVEEYIVISLYQLKILKTKK